MANGARFVPNKAGMKDMERYMRLALEQAGAATLTKVVGDQVIPFDQGTMQNDSTYIDISQSAQGEVQIITDAPQARRLYYHPEYNFQTVNNPRAGGGWFDYLVNGAEKDFTRKAFASRLRKLSNGGGRS